MIRLPSLLLLVAALTLPLDALPFQLFIRNFNDQVITLEVDSSDTVENVKQMIRDREGVPTEQQILEFNGIVLEDGRTLQDYSIQKEDTLILSLRLSEARPVNSMPSRSLWLLAALLALAGAIRVRVPISSLVSGSGAPVNLS